MRRIAYTVGVIPPEEPEGMGRGRGAPFAHSSAGVRLARGAGQHSLQMPLEVSPFSAWVPLDNDAEAIESHTTGGWRGDT
jgi:hypothetical protein